MQPVCLKVTALEIKSLAQIISKCSGQNITAETIQNDITAGAPVNADGTINLVHYAAWLVKENGNGI